MVSLHWDTVCRVQDFQVGRPLRLRQQINLLPRRGVMGALSVPDYMGYGKEI